VFSKRGRRKVFSKQKAMNDAVSTPPLINVFSLRYSGTLGATAQRRHQLGMMGGGGVTVSMPPLINVFSLRYSGYY
jgi:hypothetical protein